MLFSPRIALLSNRHELKDNLLTQSFSLIHNLENKYFDKNLFFHHPIDKTKVNIFTLNIKFLNICIIFLKSIVIKI